MAYPPAQSFSNASRSPVSTPYQHSNASAPASSSSTQSLTTKTSGSSKRKPVPPLIEPIQQSFLLAHPPKPRTSSLRGSMSSVDSQDPSSSSREAAKSRVVTDVGKGVGPSHSSARSRSRVLPSAPSSPQADAFKAQNPPTSRERSKSRTTSSTADPQLGDANSPKTQASIRSSSRHREGTNAEPSSPARKHPSMPNPSTAPAQSTSRRTSDPVVTTFSSRTPSSSEITPSSSRRPSDAANRPSVSTSISASSSSRRSATDPSARQQSDVSISRKAPEPALSSSRKAPETRKMPEVSRKPLDVVRQPEMTTPSSSRRPSDAATPTPVSPATARPRRPSTADPAPITNTPSSSRRPSGATSVSISSSVPSKGTSSSRRPSTATTATSISFSHHPLPRTPEAEPNSLPPPPSTSKGSARVVSMSLPSAYHTITPPRGSGLNVKAMLSKPASVTSGNASENERLRHNSTTTRRMAMPMGNSDSEREGGGGYRSAPASASREKEKKPNVLRRKNSGPETSSSNRAQLHVDLGLKPPPPAPPSRSPSRSPAPSISEEGVLTPAKEVVLRYKEQLRRERMWEDQAGSGSDSPSPSPGYGKQFTPDLTSVTTATTTTSASPRTTHTATPPRSRTASQNTRLSLPPLDHSSSRSLTPQSLSRSRSRSPLPSKAPAAKQDDTTPYYTVFGATSGRVVAVGGPEDSWSGFPSRSPKHATSASASKSPTPQDKQWATVTVGRPSPPKGGLGKLSRKISGRWTKNGDDDFIFDGGGAGRMSLQEKRRPVVVGVHVVDEGRGSIEIPLPSPPMKRKSEPAPREGGMLWKLMKRISTGGLRERYEEKESEAPPPVPQLPKELRSANVKGPREKAGKKEKEVPRPLPVPRAPVPAAPTTTTTNANRAQSPRSSSSSYGEVVPPSPSKYTLGQHIVSPEILEYNMSVVQSPPSISSTPKPKSSWLTMRSSMDWEVVRSPDTPQEKSLPLPRRRPRDQSLGRDSPLLGEFVTDGAVNAFPPKKSDASSKSSSPATTVSPGSYPPLTPPPRPTKSPMRPVTSPISTQDTTRHRARSMDRDRGRERGRDRSTRSEDTKRQSSYTGRISRASMSTVMAPTAQFRELPMPTLLTEKEKSDMWNELLERSARAGGTLRVGAEEKLESDELRFSVVSDLSIGTVTGQR